MPYVNVEVWIDDPDCKGGCEAADLLKDRRDHAIILILSGNYNKAVDMLSFAKPQKRSEVTAEQRHLFETWKSGNLEGFSGPETPENRHESLIKQR